MACKNSKGMYVCDLAAHDAEVRQALAAARAEMKRREANREFRRHVWLQAKPWLPVIAVAFVAWCIFDAMTSC